MPREARRIAFLVALHSAVVAQQAAPTKAQSLDPAQSSVQSKRTTTDADFAEARRLIQQGKIDDAIAELEVLEASDPNAKGLDLELGTAYYKKSDYVKAVEFLKKAVASDPNNGEATQLLGLSYYLNGYPGQAIPLLENVQACYPR